MKQPTFNGRELLPLSVMEAAHAGDAIAMEQVLRYYECYINKLCTRTLYDSNGIPYAISKMFGIALFLIRHEEASKVEYAKSMPGNRW